MRIGPSIKSRRVFAAVAASTMCLTAAACGSGGELEEVDGKAVVSFRSDVYFTGAVLPFLVGVDKGIYEKHGLDVEVQPGKGSATTIQTVANGSDDFGYADAGALVQARAKRMDVQMVAGMVQTTPLALFATADSGITRPADIEGRSAGFTPGSAAEVLFPAYAAAEGLDRDKVELLKVDIPTRTTVFLKGQADFTFGLTNTSLFSLQSKIDDPLVTFRYADAGLVALSSGIVTSDEFAEENPEAVKAFLEATAEAVEYTNANLDDAVDSFFRVDKDSSVPPEVVKQQWTASHELAHTERTSGQPFGCTASDDWKATIDLMEEYGGVEKGAVEVADVGTNEFNAGCEEELS